MSGEQFEVVVAYKDRLARFGYELIEGIINRNVCKNNKTVFEP